MDTKLKKYKLNPIIKGVVLILTLIFAFLAGTNGLELARKTIYFNNAERIQDTPAYKENIENEIGNIFYRESIVYALSNYYGQNMSFEEFCEKSEIAQDIKAANEENLKKALDYFDQITEIKKLEPKNDGTYYDEDAEMFFDQYDHSFYSLDDFKENIYFENNPYSESEEPTTIYYNSDVTRPYAQEADTTVVSVEIPNVINKVYKTHAEWEYEYQKLRDNIFSLVDDARSPETIKAEFEDKLISRLSTAYGAEEIALEDFRQEYQNIDFLAINKETGCFVSSFTEETDIENFKKNYKINAFYYYYFDGVKTIDSTEINIETPQSPLLKFIYSLFEIERIYYTNVELINEYSGSEIYIRVNQPLVEKDEFYSLNEAFIKNSTLSEKELEAKTTIFSILTLIGMIALAILSKPKYIDEKLKLCFNQKMFFIIQLCLFAFFVFCAGAGIAAVVFVDFLPEASMGSGGIEFLMNSNTMPELVGIFLAVLVFFITNFVNYIVVNKKAGTFKERFICYKLFKVLRKLAGRNKDLRNSVKQIEKKLLIIFSIWVILELFFAAIAYGFAWEYDGFSLFLVILFLVNTIVGIIFALRFLSQVKTLAIAVENMKNGNLDINLDSTKFVFPLKDFARNLNECRDSIEKAVSEALKGERLKTELITNVSHDLKTPLTSIINYVSLLKLCNIEGEDENKYLDILDEKSTKLKRLIEDLTEASKASSGNIKMTVDTVNLNELALQAVGENNDVLENVGLEIVVSQKDNDLFVKADSQHTFRIFDNLFSNVKKYALSGTRVYVDVYKESGYGVFSVKNISKDKLNINPDEITERFVRGDNSRTTEGSGLGLSIARSFTELQNGTFSIEIDGDLFKVTVKLPITNKPQIKKDTPTHTENEFGVAREKIIE